MNETTKREDIQMKNLRVCKPADYTGAAVPLNTRAEEMMMMNALLLLCGISLSFSLQRAAAPPVYCMQRDLDI